ncbi:MAG: hypothetical protein ACLPXB_03955 [Thiobacillaceae bacterium]
MKKLNCCSFVSGGAFLMLAFLVGCAGPMEAYEEPMVAYEGPARPKEQVVVIRPAALSYIDCIDGKANYTLLQPTMSAGPESAFKVYHPLIQALPGKHQLVAGFEYQEASGNSSTVGLPNFYSSTLEFEAQPGHEYDVNGHVIDSKPLMSVKDITTNQTIVQNAALYRGHKHLWMLPLTC